MTIELLIALIPALPLVGFLFAVFVGPRLDHVPTHATHGGPEGPTDTGHGEPAAHSASHGAGPIVDDADYRSVPTEEEQRATSPHHGHADDLANAEGAQGVIPREYDDGLGQSGHVTPGAPRPRYRSWIVPTVLVGLSWLASMVVFASVIFGGNEHEVVIYEWIASGD
ncbi:MAG: hypothetical protein WKF38_00485, partial [Candidatus Limnocylindrales bacterium]